MLGYDNYKSVNVIIYTNFLVHTLKNSFPLEVFGDIIFLSSILYGPVVQTNLPK